MRRSLTLLLASFALASAPDARADELLDAARARADNEQAELERARRQRDATRRTDLERLEAALAARAAAEADADAVEAERAALAGQLARPGESPDVRKRRLDAMAARLRGFSAASPGASGDDLRAALDAALERRLAELSDAASLRSGVEPVLARSGLEVDAPVLRVGAVMAVVGGDGDAAGFATLDGGETLRVEGLALEAGEADAFRAAARGDLSRVPLDVDGSLVRTTGTLRRSFADRLEAGGFFVWPIILIGLLGLLLVAERGWFLLRERIPPERAARVLGAVRAGRDPTAALTERSAFERVAKAGVSTRSRPRDEREAALETALLHEEPRLQRSVGLIAACAAIAPLLGLLGTVTGMIATFEVITVHGTGNPKLLSGGISVALVTTQFGLIVAVPLLLAHAVVSRLVQRRGARLEALRSAFLEADASSTSASGDSDGGAEVEPAREAPAVATASGGGRS